MTQSDISSSNRLATPVGGTVQKPHVLIVPEDSEKAKASYILNYPGEIKVVTRKEYENYIKEMASTSTEDVPAETVTTLHPPTNLYWDPKNPADIQYGTNGTAATIDIYITFDPSFDEIVTDGKDINYVPTVTLTDPSTAQALANSGADQSANGSQVISPSGSSEVSTIELISKSSSSIQLRWLHIKNATGYEVVSHGVNMLNSAGRSSTTRTEGTNTANGGYHYFTVSPVSGKSLTGNYYFVIKTKYNKSLSTGKRFPSSGYISI